MSRLKFLERVWLILWKLKAYHCCIDQTSNQLNSSEFFVMHMHQPCRPCCAKADTCCMTTQQDPNFKWSTKQLFSLRTDLRSQTEGWNATVSMCKWPRQVLIELQGDLFFRHPGCHVAQLSTSTLWSVNVCGRGALETLQLFPGHCPVLARLCYSLNIVKKIVKWHINGLTVFMSIRAKLPGEDGWLYFHDYPTSK